MLILLRLNLQIALRADGRLATFRDVAFGVVHEANGAFAVCFGEAGVGSFEARGEFAVADEAADLFWFPLA